jgi:hypothetical protein
VEQLIHGGARGRVGGHTATDRAMDQAPLVQDSRLLAPGLGILPIRVRSSGSHPKTRASTASETTETRWRGGCAPAAHNALGRG